jgi:putative phosphoesterase
VTSQVTRVVVLSDTHIKRGWARRLPDEVYAALGDADLILHAGDVLIPELLDELAGFAPTTAVLGNNDVELSLPETEEVVVDGVRIGMIHDSGPRSGRPARLRKRFPEADIVVFGHSHQPVCEEGVDGQLLFNPGSPTERRREPQKTYGILEVGDGRILRADVVPIPT